jgi:hypothetical protein
MFPRFPIFAAWSADLSDGEFGTLVAGGAAQHQRDFANNDRGIDQALEEPPDL